MKAILNSLSEECRSEINYLPFHIASNRKKGEKMMRSNNPNTNSNAKIRVRKCPSKKQTKTCCKKIGVQSAQTPIDIVLCVIDLTLFGSIN